MQESSFHLGFESGFSDAFDAQINRANALKQQGVPATLQAKFAAVESLITRAMRFSNSVQLTLEPRIELALTALEAAMPNNADAAENAKHIPEAASQSLALIQSLQQQLKSDGLNESQFAEGGDEQLSFEEMLKQEEQRVLAALKPAKVAVQGESDQNNADDAATPAKQEPDFAELKSAKAFKALHGKYQIEHLVHLSKEESPENPGPLNPQMLAVKSLTVMDDISPVYLRRFISYLDTLFYLDEVSGKIIKKAKQ